LLSAQPVRLERLEMHIVRGGLALLLRQRAGTSGARGKTPRARRPLRSVSASVATGSTATIVATPASSAFTIGRTNRARRLPLRDARRAPCSHPLRHA
jgi:hypothetical protein